MAAEWKCRSCRTPLAGAAHVRLPTDIHSPAALCLTCADREAAALHTRVLHEWVPRYVASIKQNSPVQALRAEVKELRALLDQLTQPDTKEQ